MTTELLKTLYGPESLNYQLFMAINHAHHPLLDPVMAACITLGSSRMLYYYGALLLCIALLRRDLVPVRLVCFYGLAVIVGIGAEELLKSIFQVPRPALAIGRDNILILGEVRLHNSFPSGHATFAFLTASFLGCRRSWPVKTLLFGFALVVAWSRVYVGAHYPLDVAGGALVGMATGFAVWKLYELRTPRLIKEQPGVEKKEEPS